jgi:DNA (cytosine-5)-methyltransferase 1
MRCIELFAGGGGMALGLEAAGFKTEFLVECDSNACATLRRNRNSWRIHEGDVREVDFSEFHGVQLVAGGPPCQPFSVGGLARGYNDNRDMFPEAVRAVREVKPAAFIFENVRGLTRPSFRNYVEYIRLQMMHPDFPISANIPWDKNHARLQRFHTQEGKKKISYKVFQHVVNAADYGVPQKRHRIFFVGFRSDLKGSGWHFPLPTHSKDGLNNLKKWQTVEDALHGLPNPRRKNSIQGHIFQPGARVYPGHTGSPINEPAKALKAGDHGVPGGENMIRHRNGKVRYFTMREAARIQTFPDDWIMEGAWTETMRQIGNAVPVHLVKVVALSVFNYLENSLEKETFSDTLI